MTLEEIVLFCQQNNIARWKGWTTSLPENFPDQGIVELEFFPAPAAVPNLPDAAVDTVLVTRKLGKDGLTAEQQIENYGKVIDAND